MDKQPLNDNERRGLPADIDLLQTAITILQTNPHDIRRVENLNEVMARVKPQVEAKIIELKDINDNQCVASHDK